MKKMTPILKELLISTIRENRLFAIAYIKELGLLGVRLYKITEDEKDLLTLNNLANIIKKYEDNEKSIYKKI